MDIGKLIHAASWEIPGLLLQLGIIGSLMLFTYGLPIETLVGGIAAIVWLKVTQDDSVQDFMKIRAQKELFLKTAEWLDRQDADQEFDDAYAKHLGFYSGVDHDDYTAVTYAKGILNRLRRLAATILSIYLVVVVALEVLRNGI